MRFDAVLFDLDGTLTESAPGIMNSVAFAYECMGEAAPDESVLREFIGPPLLDSFMKISGFDRTRAEKAVEYYRQRHVDIGWREARVYTGILRLLISLKDAGAYIALASSKPADLCIRTLEHFGLLGFFSKISAPDAKNAHIKKAQLIREALPEKYENACMVGDRRFDMEGAREAGVFAIGAGYGYGSCDELENAGAQAYCESVDELSKLLLGANHTRPGFFITFEGADGCGKTTQIRLLYEYLSECGANVSLTREPGGCEISERIRSLVLDVKAMGMTDECEALLFAAQRSQHVKDMILPALKNGEIVLCDRFVDASIAYQGAGRGLGDWVRLINAPAVGNCMPDITLWFDIDPKTALSRRISASGADRIESEGAGFMKRVNDAFAEMCKKEPDRIVRVDASGNIEQIQDRVRQIVMDKVLGTKSVITDTEV